MDNEGYVIEDENLIDFDDPTSYDIDDILGLEDREYSPDTYDQYVGAEINLPRGDRTIKGRVAKRRMTNDKTPVGVSHPNPMLDDRQYIVEMEDDSEMILTANTIAQNMLSQVDSEGRSYRLFEAIIGHRHDDTALFGDDAEVQSASGKRFIKTTKG